MARLRTRKIRKMRTSYRYATRNIGGASKKVKIHTYSDGRQRIRIVGHKNLIDNEVSKAKRKRRIKGYVNNTDNGNKNYKRTY